MKSRGRCGWKVVMGWATALGIGQLGATASTLPLVPKSLTPPEKRLKSAKTKPICVMTCTQYNLKRLLKFRRIPVVFRRLTAVQTKPNFFGNEMPISSRVGRKGVEAGGLTAPRRQPLTEREQWEAWREMRRREWIRQRAENQARAQRARLGAGVPNAGATSSTSGEAVPPHDVRGP